MKSENAKLFIEKVPEPKELKLHKATRERRSLAIWKFLETHPGIKIRFVATEADYTPQNFDKYRLEKKTMPQDLLLKVEKILSQYGLTV